MNNLCITTDTDTRSNLLGFAPSAELGLPAESYAGGPMYRMPNAYRGVVADEIKLRERVLLVDVAGEDVGALAGAEVTRGAWQVAIQKSELEQLAQRFASEGYSSVSGEECVVTQASADAAKALFRLLPQNVRLPKIAPDGDGGLMAVWGGEDDTVALVVDNWKLHLVTAASTTKAQYFPDVPFDGERLPSSLIEAMQTHLR